MKVAGGSREPPFSANDDDFLNELKEAVIKFISIIKVMSRGSFVRFRRPRVASSEIVSKVKLECTSICLSE